MADLVHKRRNVPYQSAASVQVSRSYEVRGSKRSRRISRVTELSELTIRANSILEFGVDTVYLPFFASSGRALFLHLTGVAMSHLEKFDAVIHDTIEPAVIGCGITFRALSFIFNFATVSGALETEAHYGHH